MQKVALLRLAMALPAVAQKPTITTFDVPGAGTGPGQGTVPIANNPANLITGYFIDTNGVNHGFLRTP
jgi:hypothetical protein